MSDSSLYRLQEEFGFLSFLWGRIRPPDKTLQSPVGVVLNQWGLNPQYSPDNRTMSAGQFSSCYGPVISIVSFWPAATMANKIRRL